MTQIPQVEPATAHRVVVVGGANTDVVGHSYAALVDHDSNPGYVRISSGGVGRNIAENLARLGVSVELVTALGGDQNAAALAEHCAQVGVGLAHAVHAPDLPGSLYLAILDEGGDMALAMNDMRALERLTAQALEAHKAAFDGASIVAVDANLSSDALEWLVANVEAPVVIDPVSAAKAPRALGVLDGFAALKCNALEAAQLAGEAEPATDAGIERLAQTLLEHGVGAVYVTAGTRGVHYADEHESGWLAAPRVEVANATGAGDAFSAGVVAGMLEGWGVRRCAAYGSALAAIALASEHTVSDRVSHTAAREAMEELL